MPGVQESSARIAGLVYAESEAVWVTVVRNVGYEDERGEAIFLNPLFNLIGRPWVSIVYHGLPHPLPAPAPIFIGPALPPPTVDNF